MIVLRLHLDQVEADELQPAQASDQSEGVPAAGSAYLGRPGAWRECGVNEVDVEAQEDRPWADPLPDLDQHVVHAALQEHLGRNQVQPQDLGATPIIGPVAAAADPDLHGACWIDQAFLDRAATPRPMR